LPFDIGDHFFEFKLMANILLPQSFYLNDDVVQIAMDLLGKELVSTIGGQTTTGKIVETEAYKAPDDLACHARGNTRTTRTETMFSEGGCSYVYICYGIHHLFNVVTGPEGSAHAVLIRAVEPLQGKEVMQERRKMKKEKKEMVNGPGKFTRAMAITNAHDNILLYDSASPIKIREANHDAIDIISGPRVGMSHHTKESGHWPWRFRIKGNQWTSKPDVVKYNW
jgi:DNA-3-methyladenine glycosylase